MNLAYPHVQFEKLVDLAEQRLVGEELDKARAHLADCERCAEQHARLERAIKMMRVDESEDAPRAAITAVLNSFGSRARSEPSAMSRLVAILTFDSLQAAPALGLRAGSEAERQLVYAAGEIEVHLQVTPVANDWAVCGQVLGECAGGVAELSNASASIKVALDEGCEFELPAVAEGNYKLTIRAGDVEMEIPELALG